MKGMMEIFGEIDREHIEYYQQYIRDKNSIQMSFEDWMDKVMYWWPEEEDLK